MACVEGCQESQLRLFVFARTGNTRANAHAHTRTHTHTHAHCSQLQIRSCSSLWSQLIQHQGAALTTTHYHREPRSVSRCRLVVRSLFHPDQLSCDQCVDSVCLNTKTISLFHVKKFFSIAVIVALHRTRSFDGELKIQFGEQRLFFRSNPQANLVHAHHKTRTYKNMDTRFIHTDPVLEW